MTIEKANYAHILRKQLTIFGSWNSDFSASVNEWEECLKAIADGVIQPEKLITHTVALSQADKAFEIVKSREFYNKIMVVAQ